MTGVSPDVSVVVPTFNRAALVGRAVRSCFGSRELAVEVIVVDDGSTDDTRAVLHAEFAALFRDESPAPEAPAAGPGPGPPCPRLRYRRQPHQGVSAARNTGLRMATGERVKFLDSDDELLPGALAREVACARESHADVVVSGYDVRFYDEAGRTVLRRRAVPAPHLEHGVDDMLRGQCPWTAAALYRRDRIAGLAWDTATPKAEEWLWAWTVCFAGARFTTLDIASAAYNHYHRPRMTTTGDTFHDSTAQRQRILRLAEDRLREAGELTRARREALVQYYYKDSKVLCDMAPRRWRTLWRHCRELAPGFRPAEPDPIVRPCVTLFGPYWGVRLFVGLRAAARRFGFRRGGSYW